MDSSTAQVRHGAQGIIEAVGEDVSSDTLKGTNGTVLLFFRSADW
jgi:hypothetical protein